MLMEGVSKNDIPSIRLILSHHFPDGMNALMVAARDGNLSACQNLVSYGCPLDSQDFRGYTALIYASRDGYVPIVRLLLQAGANASICTKYGYSALLAACNNGFADTVQLLCSYVDPNCRDTEGYTPLICAFMNNHPETAITLLDHGGDPTLRDVSGRNAIMHAVDGCCCQVLQVLLDRHIYLEYTTEQVSYGVLYLSAVRHQCDLVHLLLFQSDYLREFVKNLVSCSNVTAEALVENVLRSENHTLSESKRKELAMTVIIEARTCIIELISTYLDQISTTYPLSGLVEASVWCIRVHKILMGNSPAKSLEFFWSFLEHVLTLCSNYESIQEGELNSNSPSCTEVRKTDMDSLLPSTDRKIKLLISFIEIYCIGMSSVWNGQEETRGEPLPSSPRLSTLFHRNLAFIK